MPAEIAFMNARIHTVDDKDTVAEAVLVRNERIAAIGTTASVMSIASPTCTTYDLQGQLVVPGFVDPHNHLSLTALEGAAIDCYSEHLTSLDELLHTISEGCRSRVPGQWVRGVGFAPFAMTEGRGPTRHELDEAAPANPFFLLDLTCNEAFANTAALEQCGITEHSPQPWGGLVVRDERGRTTGELMQAAINPLQTASWRAAAADDWDLTLELLRTKMQEYLSYGLTGICDPAVTPDFAEMYTRADRVGLLPFTVQQLFTADDFFGRQDLRRQDWIDRARGRESARLRGGTMKLFVDHVFPDGPAMDRMVDGCRVHTGTSYYSGTEVEDLAVTANSLGIRTAVHAMGNCSVASVLDAYESVRRTVSSDVLLRIEHAHVIERSQAVRMADLGVDVVAKPGNIKAFGAGFDAWKGEDSDSELSIIAVKSMLDAGVRVSFGSDAPCASSNPFETIGAAVTRLAPDGYAIEPTEAVSVLQALRCHTVNAAIAADRGHEEGSIEVGKRANLVVVDQDFTTCDPNQIRETRALITLVDGAVVHESKDSPRPVGQRARSSRV